MTTATATKWKQLLLESRTMRGRAAGMVFERVKLLNKIYEDQEFRADNGDLDDGKAADLLDAEVSDTCSDFLSLRATLRQYPKREQWLETPLNRLVAQALAKDTESVERPKRERKTATVAEVQEAQEEAVRAAARAGMLADELANTREQLSSLRDENNKLRIENATLSGRITELERAVTREGRNS